MAHGTTPTQIRLTEEDKAKIEEIRARYGLPSMAAAIRYAVERLHLSLPAPDPGVPKKARKNPGKKRE